MDDDAPQLMRVPVLAYTVARLSGDGDELHFQCGRCGRHINGLYRFGAISARLEYGQITR